jgi:Recombination endonuclease VII
MASKEYNRQYYKNRFVIGSWSGKGNHKVCGNTLCGQSFVMVRSDQLYCSTGCRSKSHTVRFHRRDSLKKSYGITPEQYDDLNQEQGGVCRICKKTCSTGQNLSVDHDHLTGKVRALLCKKCNSAIGLLGDDASVAQSAVDYLKEFGNV